MVDIQRLARGLLFFAIGLLLGGVSVIASAEDYSAARLPWTVGGSFSSSTAEDSCQQYAVSAGRPEGFLGEAFYGEGGLYAYECKYVRSNGQIRTSYVELSLSCPAGGTLDTSARMCRNAPPCETGERNLDGTCFTCPEGRTWNGTTCVSKCELDAGKSAGTGDTWVTVDLDSTPSGDASFCMGGCIVRGARTECVGAESATSGGDYVQIGHLCQIQGPFTQTGGSCTPGTGSTPNFVGVEQEGRPWWDTGKDERECVESGGQPGEVSGSSVCVRPQSGETWDTKTGSSSEPTKTTTQNQDGTSTETTTTTSTSTSGGKATTTTTTTTTTKDSNGDIIGTETTTETTEQPVDDFCAKNPKDPKCVGKTAGGKFAGTCGTGFKCTGDAVQCAIAELAHVERCEALEMAEENALTDLAGEGWEGVADITVEQEQRALNRDGAFDFDLGQVWTDSKEEYVTFTKECISVPPIDILGTRIEFDVGVLCDVGAVLRLFMHLLAYLGAIRMIVAKV